VITALIPVREGTDIEDIRQLLAGTRIHRAPVMAAGRLAASSAGVCPSRGTCWSSLCATPSVETHTRVQEWQQNDCVTLQITPISQLPIPITFWRGEAGDPVGAVAGFEALLVDQQRVLGADHPDTLRTRNNVSHWRHR